MTMQVQCPNASCGKVLIVQELYAGKKGKCPACGGEMTIPAAFTDDRSAGRRLAEPRSFPAEREAEPASALPMADPGDEGDIRPPSASRSGRAAETKAGFLTHAALAVGISALVVLSLSPKMEWTYLVKSTKLRTSNPGVMEMPRVDSPLFGETALVNAYLNEPLASIDFLYCSLAVAVLALIALMLSSTQQRDLADGAIAASGSAAVGWGVLAGMWQLAIVWKVFSLSSYIHEQQLRTGGRATDTSVWPGPGLGVGLLAALLVVAVFGSLVASRKRVLWLFTAGGMGFLLGLLLLVLHVKPWKEFGP